METFLNRYRNITVLLLVIFAQLILLAVQVKNDQDVRIIRIWTITAITPVARAVEAVRGGTVGFLHNYVTLHEADAENRHLRQEVGRLKIENIYLKDQLNTADRAKALQLFQAKTPSRMLAATIIGTGAGAASEVVFVDAGSVAGVARGMAVLTPDGIVGKVIEAYPTASEVLKVTDSQFAAGVVSQKNGVRGTLKGQGTPACRLDYVPSEDKIEVGEMLFTSGDDRIFPRGFPAGIVKAVHDAQPFKDILVEPVGLQRGLDDVLIVTEGVHQEIPAAPPANQQVYIAPPPPAQQSQKPQAADEPAAPPAGTEADRLRAAYKAVGEAQNHTFGEGLPGSKPPDFTRLGVPSAQPGAPGRGASPAPNSNSATRPPAGAAPSPNSPKPSDVTPAAASKTAPAGAPSAAPPKPANNPVPKSTDTQRKSNQNAGAPDPAGRGVPER